MEKHEAVLLSKAQADLKLFVSKDKTIGSLHKIKVTSEYAEASDGHILLRVPHDGMNPSEWPWTQGEGEGLRDGNYALVNTKILEKAFSITSKRDSLPILNYVCLTVDKDGSPIVTATDLETGVNFRQRKDEWNIHYPDTDVVIPDKRDRTITIAAGILSRLADWTEKHGDRNKSIEFYISGEIDAVLCKIPRADAPAATAVFAPICSYQPKKDMTIKYDEVDSCLASILSLGL